MEVNFHHTLADASPRGGYAAPAALRVGLLGFGNVGGGTFRVLARNQALIHRRVGRPIIITMVSVRNLSRVADELGDAVALVQDPGTLVSHPEIDVVVEAMGGIHPARDLVLCAIAHGKHVVTANKALLAEHGAEIFTAARKAGVVVAYEGAVAVSIPIIKALREGLTANRVEWVAGIINGTTNFILSKMVEEGATFEQALQEAQRLGFAEADPRLDVQGIDAAHKLSLLAANAFGTPIQLDQIAVQGIADLDPFDLSIARRWGYCTKLLALAQRTEGRLALSVGPTLLPQNHLLAQVHGSMNGVMVKGDASGITLHYGAGAGAEQTASAVIADLVDVCRSIHLPAQHRVPLQGFQADAIQDIAMAPQAACVSTHYLRVDVDQRTDAAATLSSVWQHHGIAIERQEVIAHASDRARRSIAILAGPAPLSALQHAIADLEASPMVLGRVRTILGWSALE